MARVHGALLYSILLCTNLVCLALQPAHAEDVEFLPEFDANLKVNSLLQLTFQAKGEREAGDQEQFQIGPSIQFYLKPLVRLKEVTTFDLNDAKKKISGIRGRVSSRHHGAKCRSRKSDDCGNHIALSLESWLPDFGPESRRSRLAERWVHLALSEQDFRSSEICRS